MSASASASRRRRALPGLRGCLLHVMVVRVARATRASLSPDCSSDWISLSSAQKRGGANPRLLLETGAREQNRRANAERSDGRHGPV